MANSKWKPSKGGKLGNWELRRQIGKGGNAFIWSAIDKNSHEAAIKILSSSSDYAFKRFKNEIEALNTFNGTKGVLPIWEHHLASTACETDPSWFAMPIAKPLSKMKIDDLTLQKAVEMVFAISQALVQVHKQNMSHRDIKPENILLYENSWCLADFGLVEIDPTYSLTSNEKKLGPTFYIAPEMLNAPKGSDGKAADVYSLAKLLWKLGTGQNFPIPGTFDMRTEALRLSSYTENKRAIELNALLERATAIDPALRPTIEQFRDELRFWLQPSSSSGQASDIDDLQREVEQLTSEYKYEQSNAKDNRDRCAEAKRRITQAFQADFSDLIQKLIAIKFDRISDQNFGIGVSFDFSESYSKHKELGWSTHDIHSRDSLSQIIRMIMRVKNHNVVIKFGIEISQSFYDPNGLRYPKWADEVLLIGGYLFDINTPSSTTDRKNEVISVIARKFHFEEPSEREAIVAITELLKKDLRLAVKTAIEAFEKTSEILSESRAQ